MEHTEQDIKCINFGYSVLDLFLKNEMLFIDMISNSEPYRYCIGTVYQTLTKIGELPIFWRVSNTGYVKEYELQAKEWCKEAEGNKLSQLTRCAMVLSHFAEKRLEVTSGK